MVKVKCKQKSETSPTGWIAREIYLDGYLKSNLDVGVKQLNKDFDQVWFVDGREGGGKTNIAVTCAYYVSRPEDRHTLINRIVPGIDKVKDVILDAKPFQSIVIDEAYGGMSATGFASKINRVLQKMFTEIRAKNLFVFIVAPSFMDISRYFAIWRSQCLLHVYTKGDERGYATFYNSNSKKKLYILGKKQFYNYSVSKPNFIFRFTKEMDKIIDKKAYDDKKRKANLEKGDDDGINRNALKRYIMERLEVMKDDEELKKKLPQKVWGNVFGVTSMTISRYLLEIEQNNHKGEQFII